nr:putative tRNA ligase [Oceanusvirus sp.]
MPFSSSSYAAALEMATALSDRAFSPRQAVRVYLVVGPIGSGKTTTADQLARHLKNAVHVDGDVGYLMTAGFERTVMTVGACINAVASGRALVLSTGGGVLFDRKGEFVLGRSLASAFPSLDFEYHLVVTEPSDERGFREVAKDEIDLSFCYGRRDLCEETIAWRKENGEGFDGVTPEAMATKSAGNEKFAARLIELCGHLYLTPFCNPAFPRGRGRLPVQPVEAREAVAALAGQHRLSVRLEAEGRDGALFKHVTCYYGDPSEFVPELYSAGEYGRYVILEEASDRPVSVKVIATKKGAKVVCKPSRDPRTVELAVTSGSEAMPPGTHATVKPGKHMAYQMRDAALQLESGSPEIFLPVLDPKTKETIESVRYRVASAVPCRFVTQLAYCVAA